MVDLDTHVGGGPEPEAMFYVPAVLRAVQHHHRTTSGGELEQAGAVVADVDIGSAADLGEVGHQFDVHAAIAALQHGRADDCAGMAVADEVVRLGQLRQYGAVVVEGGNGFGDQVAVPVE